MKGERDTTDKIYVVVDTNVLVSALLTENPLSSTSLILGFVLDGPLIPLYNDTILDEYKEVLGRKKFNFNPKIVSQLLSAIKKIGIKTEPTKVDCSMFPDQDDIVFYEIRMSVDDSYLVTGNIKHYPEKPFVVTPAQMVVILKEKNLI